MYSFNNNSNRTHTLQRVKYHENLYEGNDGITTNFMQHQQQMIILNNNPYNVYIGLHANDAGVRG